MTRLNWMPSDDLALYGKDDFEQIFRNEKKVFFVELILWRVPAVIAYVEVGMETSG